MVRMDNACLAEAGAVMYSIFVETLATLVVVLLFQESVRMDEMHGK